MIGTSLLDLSATAAEVLRGASTCTHLTSLVRAIAAPAGRAIDSFHLNM
jgi:hypothetical protein